MNNPVFTVILYNINTCINSAFTWAESLFGTMGIALLTLFVIMIVSSFVVRKFIGSFIK